jgi:tripartite-type tricarboxylate transporter receptor subunit TctC
MPDVMPTGRISMTTVSRRTALALPAALLAAPALAQGFPTQPINMAIPFAAGGPTDTVGRLIAEAMSRDLGQSVLVVNVGGARGVSRRAARRAGAAGRPHHPAAPHRHGDDPDALPPPGL